jgi:hypothetical protein
MRDRLVRRLFPLVASAGLIVVGMFTTTWGPDRMLHATEWALPYDYWGTLIAATRLVHGQVGGLYTQPTGLVSLPGTAIILMPVAAVISGLGLSLHIPGPGNLHPAVWLIAGPYQMALCCVELFAADALAERLGVTQWKRGILAVAGACALWSVSARWGHPEDAVAVGLLLYAVLALADDRPVLAGWLAGAAVCVQPLVLLAVPAAVALLPWRRVPWFLIRAALPSAVLLGIAGLANWDAMYTSVTSQPNSPVVNHPTAWTSLAPHMAGGNVAAGPFRLATIALACLCAVAVRRRWGPHAQSPSQVWRAKRAAGGYGGSPPRETMHASSRSSSWTPDGDTQPQWEPRVLADVLWFAALALALRSFFEPVMVSYYPWPPLAVALIPAARGGWVRLLAAGVIAGGVTAQGQGPWHNVLAWWVPLVAGLLVLLAVSWPGRWRRRRVVAAAATVALASTVGFFEPLGGPRRADVALQVPGGIQRQQPDLLARFRRVDHQAVAHVHPDVPVAFEEH